MSASTRTPAVAQAYSTPTMVWLVAKREIMVRLRSVAFLVSTGIMLLLVIGSVVVGSIVATTAEPAKVAVVSGVQLPAGVDFDVTNVTDRAAAEELVRAGDVEAAIVPDSSPVGYLVIANDAPPISIIQALSVMPDVEILEASNASGFLGYIVAVGFGLVFFLSAMTFGQTIAQSVVEEKSTRVVEILLATIPTRTLLAGKILGTTILAIGQVLLLSGLAIIGLTVTGQDQLLLGLGAPILWFALFFALGFVLLASMFAATGAMVSRQEDIGSTTTPVTMLVMIPYFVVIFFNDNPLVVGIMSYVPFSAPVGMPLRLFQGTAEWWEPILSLAILVASAIIVILIASRMYENSLLRLGQRVKLTEALKG